MIPCCKVQVTPLQSIATIAAQLRGSENSR
jgi:hypothetical protein